MDNGDIIFYRFNPSSDSHYTKVTNDVIKQQYREMMDHFESIVVMEKLSNVEDPTVVIPNNSSYENWILILTYGDYGIQFEKRINEAGLRIFIRTKVEFSARYMHNLKLGDFQSERGFNKAILNHLKDLSSAIRKDIVLKDLTIQRDHNYNAFSLAYHFMMEFEAYPYFEYTEIKTIRENYFDYIYKEFKGIIERIAEEA